ncbi:hypothetical protein [Burkholderia territorii]|uniref:hypothetical protein n=1 Tax=Burkholderia territorii TaxID=1503055 RepID=UPI000AD3EFCA|nr:hypothetical protein [Burkholderia territorii]
MNDMTTSSPTPHTIVSTWKLTVGTSIFLIDVRDDGSWQPFYIAPGRLSGWARRTMPEEPAAANVNAAILAWAKRYGPHPRLQLQTARQH